MEALAVLLDHIKKQDLAQGNILGFFHVLIGRRITGAEGQMISAGLTWRELANWLKKQRWDPNLVEELGLTVEDLPPKDRQRLWYSAISRAGVDTAAGVQAGNTFARKLEALGYQVSPPPGQK